jgi:hypothetical protein
MKIDRSKILLRKATRSDIETLIEYRIIFLQEAQGTPDKELETILRKSLRQYFEHSLENNSFISWIAEYENKSIGFSGMVMREQPGNLEIPNGRTGYILNMFTVKEYRKNGICGMLFQKLIDEAKQLKLDRLDLHATQDGEPIYRQFDFAEPHDKVLELRLQQNQAIQ